MCIFPEQVVGVRHAEILALYLKECWFVFFFLLRKSKF